MMRLLPLASWRPTNDGFIIVAVLWIIAALATLASIYAIYVSNTTRALAANDDRIRAEAAINAGLAVAAAQLDTKQDAPRRGHFAFRLGAAHLTVSFTSEAARIDLNRAQKPLLAGLFAALGATKDKADNYADRVISWRTPPRAQTTDNEASLYRAAGLAYDPRQAPFASTAELWLVRDLPPQLVERALPYVTVFGSSASVNLLDAAPTVLAALPGMTPDRLETLLRQRRAAPDDDKALAALLGPLQTGTTSAKSKATRVRIDVNFNNGRRVKAEAVITLEGGNGRTPYHVLSWRDDLDGPMPDGGA